jgi:hypothetical protein
MATTTETMKRVDENKTVLSFEGEKRHRSDRTVVDPYPFFVARPMHPEAMQILALLLFLFSVHGYDANLFLFPLNIQSIQRK